MQHDLIGQLSREEQLALKNRRTGMAIFQISWIMVFVCLVMVNYLVRGNQVSWPPPGVAKPEAVLPSVSTLILIASGFLVRRAARAVRADRLPAFLPNWRWALVLGAVFVVIMAYEWLAIPYSGQYSNMFRVMVGFHAVHALAIGVYMVQIQRGARAGVYHARHFWPVEAGASLWYFVIVAWVLFYLVLYWL